ncbi:helix-turn-helix transcriptional regulator [Kribbella italica]|uniref:helix-turn-helix transcriptional regulator n=1 Tax=Kribbella italica TaxID=1540520 RepID=UPI0016119310|nr:helix-turn-helix transcriptional regulator [Kribbella italica]
MGHRVAHLRRELLADRRKAVGLSQGDLATKLDIERSTVVRWEAGRTAPQPWIRPRLADTLQVSEEQLEDLLRPEVEGDDADVNRRAFAGLATALALAPLTRARVGSLIGTSHVRQLQARTARLRRLDDHLGGMDTYTVYTSEMAATERLIKTASYSGDTARALTGVLAEQAQMAGWAAFDAGRFTDSRRHYRRALYAGRESGDPGLEGNSLAFIAYEKADSATAAESTRVAGTRTTPRVRALLHERLAWAHAVAGHPSESQRALDAAVAAVNETSSAPEPDFVFWVDPLEIDIMTGRCLAELRRSRAVSVLEDALNRYDDTHSRDKALYLTWLAQAHLDADEPERAAAVTEHALDLAAGVGSVRPGGRLRGVLQQLSRYGGREVAAVLDRARS